MNDSNVYLAHALQRLVGKSISVVRRLFFVADDTVDRTEGPLELEFEDGSVVRFQSGPNGQDMTVASERWRDPFSGDLSPENRAYIDRYGKWSVFDVSTDFPYRQICGHCVSEVRAIDLKQQSLEDRFPIEKAGSEGWNVNFKTIVGVEIVVDKKILRVESKMDELHVDIRVQS